MITTISLIYPRMEASLMVSLGLIKMPTFVRCPEVRSARISSWRQCPGKFPGHTFPKKLLVYKNNQSLTSQWQIHQSDWNSKRDLKKKSYPSASTQAKVDCCLKCLQLEESNQNCTFHNFCRARCDGDNLANGNFPLPQVTRGAHRSK